MVSSLPLIWLLLTPEVASIARDSPLPYSACMGLPFVTSLVFQDLVSWMQPDLRLALWYLLASDIFPLAEDYYYGSGMGPLSTNTCLLSPGHPSPIAENWDLFLPQASAGCYRLLRCSVSPARCVPSASRSYTVFETHGEGSLLLEAFLGCLGQHCVPRDVAGPRCSVWHAACPGLELVCGGSPCLPQPWDNCQLLFALLLVPEAADKGLLTL